MKKVILFFIIVLLFSTQAATAVDLKLMRVEIPTEKNKLLFNLPDLEKILGELNLQDMSGNIKFTDDTGNVLAILGKVKSGKIKWEQKVVNEKFLEVKLGKDEYPTILASVQEKAKAPGYQLQVIETQFDLESAKNRLVSTYEKKGKFIEKSDSLKSVEVTFTELVDLVPDMQHPIEVSPGELIGKQISVRVENQGNVPAKDFFVELVFSRDNQVPGKPATFSENFTEDMLLKDGREKIDILNPGESKTLIFKDSVIIPADTTPDKYYLAAVVDPENTVQEANESNNTFVKFMMISFPPPKRIVIDMPDTQLTYEPASFAVKIVCKGDMLSDGKDWRKCQIRAYIHQLKHAVWEKDCHWEINTFDRGIWRIKNAEFCKGGGDGDEVKMKMEVHGGSKIFPPSALILK
ncbi:MAG: hypothetical protein QG657_2728, partial [Acidobacteriota bacterium]|nr:hypothetical protein [Acidobacteriota bacterium]